MNIIKKLKALRVRAEPPGIPKSRINGTSALPNELWIMVLEFVVVEQLGDPRFQSHSVATILQTRLVCHLFDEEIQHALHHNIMHAQIPRLAMMRTTRNSPLDTTSLHTRLLARAIFNSTNNGLRVGRSFYFNVWNGMPQMSDRIRNCMRIASTITPRLDAKDLMRRLCTAASTSLWCRKFMYIQMPFYPAFSTYREGEAYMEVALLVACGYATDDVLTAMLRLAKMKKLRNYRPQWSYESDAVMDDYWFG